MTIGEAVHRIRLKVNESVSYFASRCGVSNTHLANVEAGRATPLLRLCKAIRIHFWFDPLVLVMLADATLDLAEHRQLLEVPNGTAAT